MNVSDICRRRIVTIDRDSPLSQAAKLMREHHVGALVVTADGEHGPDVFGIVTDRDLVIDVLAGGLDMARMAVGELASAGVASVAEDDDLKSALDVMREHGVRRLLVADEARQLTGIVSLDDVIEASVELVAGLGEVIRSGMARETASTAPLPVPPVLRVPPMGTAGWGQAAL